MYWASLKSYCSYKITEKSFSNSNKGAGKSSKRRWCLNHSMNYGVGPDRQKREGQGIQDDGMA